MSSSPSVPSSSGLPALALACAGFISPLSAALAATAPGEITWHVTKANAPYLLEAYASDTHQLGTYSGTNVVRSAWIYQNPDSPFDRQPIDWTVTFAVQLTTDAAGTIQAADLSSNGIHFSGGHTWNRRWFEWQVDLTTMTVSAEVMIANDWNPPVFHPDTPILQLSNQRVVNERGDLMFDLSLTQQGVQSIAWPLEGYPPIQAGDPLGTLTISAVPEPDAILLVLAGAGVATACAPRRRRLTVPGRP